MEKETLHGSRCNGSRRPSTYRSLGLLAERNAAEARHQSVGPKGYPGAAMPWVIPAEGQEQPAEGYDGRVWGWQMIADHDADLVRHLLVRFSGTVLAMGEEALSTRLATARETNGRSELEMVCAWVEPPAEIEILSHGVRSVGGDPGPEQREINEIIEWFEIRDALLIFGARGGGVGRVENPQWIKHSAHIVRMDGRGHLLHAEGLSRLDAARAAKALWESKAEPAQPGETDSTPTIEIDQETARTLTSQGYRLVWTEPTDPNDPVWMVQAYDDDGGMLEMVLGEDPQDLLLEIAEAILPKE